MERASCPASGAGHGEDDFSTCRKKNIPWGKTGGKACPVSPSFKPQNASRSPAIPETQWPGQENFRRQDSWGGEGDWGAVQQINENLSGSFKG